LIDLYTHNFDYLGSRATGNDGGSFMIAGPNWKGEKPKGITKVNAFWSMTMYEQPASLLVPILSTATC
jgi:hypothetical protein